MPHSVRATPAATRAARPTRPGWLEGVLGVPIVPKLITADLAINVVAFIVVQRAPASSAAEITMAALLVTLVLNTALVVWALRPLKLLEASAARVAAGDLDARVPETPLSDRNIRRIGNTLNDLLDGVTADRRRMRKLAAQVISAGDEERAHIARELHDSTAQSLSALEFMLAAALRDPGAAAMHDRLRVMHEVVTEALGEVRTLSHNVHPRVLDDLGLVAALEFLVRRTREQTAASVHVSSDVQVPVPAAVASVVYRVAQEAVRNAVRHAGASDVHLSLAASADEVRLEVADDGAGFDVARAMADRSGMGLFVMRERVMLVNGSLEVESRAGAGTRVRAEIPLLWDAA